MSCIEVYHSHAVKLNILDTADRRNFYTRRQNPPHLVDWRSHDEQVWHAHLWRTSGHTDRQTDRQTNRQRERGRPRQADRQSNKWTVFYATRFVQRMISSPTFKCALSSGSLVSYISLVKHAQLSFQSHTHPQTSWILMSLYTPRLRSVKLPPQFCEKSRLNFKWLLFHTYFKARSKSTKHCYSVEQPSH